MSTLFEERPEETGFRLKSFEFYNWGGFDTYLWNINPQGKSSLLTGANGSGKTTLVDALITLLVPPGKRHYNQSSGADKKRERTEESYFRGAYGSMRSNEGVSTVTQFLRGTDTYSALVGVFENTGYGNSVTLGQIRWFSGGAMKRNYFIAYRELSLENDIHPLDPAGQYRRRLQRDMGVKFFDSFNQYAAHFSSIFGFRSDKALNLFSQTVGVKVLGNLNAFIRTHMLEALNSEEEFERLYSNYQTLFSAHQKIEKASKQLELLAPVMEFAGAHKKHLAEFEKVEEIRQTAPCFFAEKIGERADFESRLLNDDLNNTRGRKLELEEAVSRLESDISDLKLSREQNDTAVRLREIDRDIKHAGELKQGRFQRFGEYTQSAEMLELPKVGNEADFSRNRTLVRQRFDEIDEGISTTRENLYNRRDSLNTKRDSLAGLVDEIKSLEARQNNIPLKNIEIRGRIAHMLGVSPGEIPFAGELIQVKDEEKDWEIAAERILHNFGLCLLVKNEYYQKVNAYVNSHDLKGRLVYFQIENTPRYGLDRRFDKNSLIYKLEVKPGSDFNDWITEYLANHFDYTCVAMVKNLSHYKQAVTMKGLIKRGRRHEKDDRPGIADRNSFILGWDNRQKLGFLKRQARELQNGIVKDEGIFDKLEAKAKELEKLQGRIDRLLEIKKFSDINWWELHSRIEALEKEQKILTAASKELKELDVLIKSKEDERIRLGSDRDKVIQHITRVEIEIENLKAEVAAQKEILEKFAHVAGNLSFEGIAAYLSGSIDAMNLESLKSERKDCIEKITVKREQLERKIAEAEKNLEKKMQIFISPPEKVTSMFPGWSEDTIELQANITFAHEFEQIHDRIAGEDLPRYRKRFREFLNEKMLEDMADFNEFLNSSEQNIKNSIEELNQSLKGIEYNKIPPTYITLHYDTTPDTAVKDFRGALRHTLGEAVKIASGDEAELESVFKRMQKLILDLKEDDTKRKKVLDVRNWLRFSAIEHYRDDGSQKQFYEDSQSLSGGEKAKLAYTILASAIAYQFGIQNEDVTKKSFRFVVIDEAFSKIDPVNSTYAMELFKQLKLQIMVVTPLDKINLVEDYIHSVHYVEAKGDNRAGVYNLTFDEYKEHRDRFSEDQEA